MLLFYRFCRSSRAFRFCGRTLDAPRTRRDVVQVRLTATSFISLFCLWPHGILSETLPVSRVGHRPVFIPPAIPRTFRRQLALRVRAATNASQHVSQTPSPIRPGISPHCLCDLPIDVEGVSGRPPGRPVIDCNDESTDDANRRLVDADQQ